MLVLTGSMPEQRQTLENKKMASLYKKQLVRTDRKAHKKVKTKSKKWWGRYRDAQGAERRVPLSTDKMAAQTMLNEVVRTVEREKVGLVDPTDGQRKRPLKTHMEEFEDFLKNKGVTPKQVKEATAQICKIVVHCKWKLIGDILASDVLDFLGKLRTDGKSAQTYNHYLKAMKQFTRWLVRDRRIMIDPLAHLVRLNINTDRRHDRRALTNEEFERLINAAKTGPPIETISGPDRVMMYVLAGWTGFRKGEIGSLTLRSFCLDDDPPSATVAACYSKRKRQDTQILHTEVASLLKEWLATKSSLGPDDLLFPVSGKVPGGKERKTHKMMRRDLEAARRAWIAEGKSEAEKEARERSDFLKYCDDDGLFADFHSNRHLFITSLEHANLSPKMAQTLARHSDVRLTLGVYTHVGLHDQTAAIESLPAPPRAGPRDEVAVRRATGTDGQRVQATVNKNAPGVVPTMVPSGAENGAILPASETLRMPPNCTEGQPRGKEKGDPTIAVTLSENRTSRTKGEQSAPLCTHQKDGVEQVSPAGFEPATFGSGGRRSIQLSYGDVPQVGDTGLEPVTPSLSNPSEGIAEHGVSY